MDEIDFDDDNSLDDTPYNALSTKERVYYQEFLERIKDAGIDYVDTYPRGLSCMMVYPSNECEISCVFQYRCCIEMKLCNPYSKLFADSIENMKGKGVWVYDDEYQLVRADSINAALKWVKSFQNTTNEKDNFFQ